MAKDTEKELKDRSPVEAFNAGASFEDEDEASYTVIRETVKKRPLNINKLSQRLFFIILGAAIFGLVASFVFAKLVPYFTEEEKPEMVEFSTDIDPQSQVEVASSEEEPIPEESEGTEAAEPSEPESSESEESVPVEEETNETSAENTNETAGDDSSKEKDPEEKPDPEAESRERILQNELLYTDLKNIADVPQKGMVVVTGITTTEDWFNVTSESRRQTSGAIVATNGQGYLILVDFRSIEGAGRILATLSDGTIAECQITKADPTTGLAILNIDASTLPDDTKRQIEIINLGNSYAMHQGDPVIAIGSPTGSSDSIEFGQITSNKGNVSVTDMEYSPIITNMQGDSGSSGVILNMKGEVIGIVMQNFAGEVGSNVITALPISPLKKRIELLSNNRNIAYLGINGQNVTVPLSEQFDIPKGIYVTEVEPDSPAFAAGIRRGDIITGVGGVEVLTMTMIGKIINEGMAGTSQPIRLKRLGAAGYVDMEIAVQIGAI